MDLQFGHYRLKRAERLLLGPDGEVELSSRSFDILCTLLASPDTVVGKAELFDAVWPNLVVEENTLQVHISALRKALAPGMIVTVHGRGYKYAGPPPLETEVDRSRAPNGQSALERGAGYKPVIAVLPFANMSGDPEQDYFSEGITEDIIVELSRYRPLNVVSRNSSSAFKGVDIKEAGRRLGARYLVEGSVRKTSDGVRVTAQLLEAESGSHVWAERYDRQLRNVFSVQDDLVRRLVSAITGNVEKHTDSRAQAKGTEDLDAYDCWLRANYGSDLWTPEGNKASRHLLEEAIKRDPLFARAHASLAYCYIRDAQLLPGSPEAAKNEQFALESAERAVRLDPSEPRAQNALGWSHLHFREFERAKSRFLISGSLNPNDGGASLDRALALAFLGEQAAADEAAEIAVALNPLGGEWFSTVLSIVHFMGRRHDAAEEHFALGPRNLPDITAWHAANLSCLGRHAEASDVMLGALEQCTQLWCGPAPMTPHDFIGWFHHVNMLRRDEDWQHLYRAFPKPPSLGLPAQWERP
jgi:adenylate cyclase